MPRQTRDDILAEIAVQMQLMTDAQVEECRAVREQLGSMGLSKRTLGQVAIEKKLLTADQLKAIHKEMVNRGFYPRLGGYEVLEQVGAGGMGVVCKARQLSLDRYVAIKILPPRLAKDAAYVARFHREAMLAAKITHPNAVHIYDVGQQSGRHYIVMEFVDGVSVEGLLAEGAMDERQALEIIRGVAAALGDAHAHNIIHRDIKPGNILLMADGIPKLSDLGLAKELTHEGGVSLTVTGAISGTPHYMSPEQCRGDKDIDHRSDIYSLGITLYKMVCGREPFKGDTPVTIMHKHLEDPLPEPLDVNPTISEETRKLIRDMTTKDKKERVQSCAEVVQRIEGILGSQTMPAVASAAAVAPGPATSVAPTLRLPDRVKEAAQKGPMARILFWVVIVLLLCGLAGAGLALLDRWRGDEETEEGAAATEVVEDPPDEPVEPPTAQEDIPRPAEKLIREVVEHMREKSDPLKDMAVMREMMKEAGVRYEPQGTRTVTVRAFVHGASVLVLHHGRAQWLNIGGAAPGKYAEQNHPTYINARDYQPTWRTKDPLPRGQIISEAFFIPEAIPPLGRLNGRLVDWEGPKDNPKNAVKVAERNGIVVVAFVNEGEKAEWYTARVEVEWGKQGSGGTPTERPPKDRRGTRPWNRR